MAIDNAVVRTLVGVLGGSTSDFPILEKAVTMLNELGIPNELLVVSAHRTPDRLFAYAEQASERGIQVIIAGAGGAAHLPGMVAAKTWLPVIGVPIPTENLGGWIPYSPSCKCPEAFRSRRSPSAAQRMPPSSLHRSSDYGLQKSDNVWSSSVPPKRSRCSIHRTTPDCLLPFS